MKKRRLIYDIESYNNFFCVAFKDYDTKEVFVFEISIRKNEYNKLVKFLETEVGILIAFNNHHYDDILLNCILKRKSLFTNSSFIDITKELKKLTNKII